MGIVVDALESTSLARYVLATTRQKRTDASLMESLSAGRCIMKYNLCAICGIGMFAILFNACSTENIGYDPSDWDASWEIGTEAASEAAIGASEELPEAVDSHKSSNTDSEEPNFAEKPTAPCPIEMVLVEGEHCTQVAQPCIQYIENPFTNPFARCRAFVEPSKCTGKRVSMRYCIDRLEVDGDDGLPLSDKSWTDAKAICESQGKRLCQEREWLFACEGEEGKPYPYGYVRDSDACNIDQTEGLTTRKGELADRRQPVFANPECLSPFGVQNMVGNVDEWVVLDLPYYSARNNNRKMQSGLKGGWWGPLRNRCRPTTVDHDEIYHDLQTGVRCCKNAE